MSKFIYKKRELRVRRKLKKVNSNRFRLSVFKSSKNISAILNKRRNLKPRTVKVKTNFKGLSFLTPGTVKAVLCGVKRYLQQGPRPAGKVAR